MAHEFGLSTEGHYRLDARLAAIREAHDTTREVPRTHPIPPAQEEDKLSFIDIAIQGFAGFFGSFGGLFSSNAMNHQVNPSYEGEVDMRVIYDNDGEEWIKIIILNDMEELTRLSGDGATQNEQVDTPSSVSTQRTRSTSHHTLPLHHSPHRHVGNLRRCMSEGFLSTWRADTRREVNRLMDQAADEVTANLHLPMPPFTQVC